MSWITDEANRNNERETNEAHQEYVIQQSQYWVRLLQQIQQDVTEINENGYWQKKLAGFPLTFRETMGADGYQISKSGFPAVLVAIRHKGDHIDVERRFTENPIARDFRTSDRLDIGTMGENVVLIVKDRERASFIVPQDASKYILKPIIESLKITKNAP